LLQILNWAGLVFSVHSQLLPITTKTILASSSVFRSRSSHFSPGWIEAVSAKTAFLPNLSSRFW
jgi:hypothetical protein